MSNSTESENKKLEAKQSNGFLHTQYLILEPRNPVTIILPLEL